MLTRGGDKQRAKSPVQNGKQKRKSFLHFKTNFCLTHCGLSVSGVFNLGYNEWSRVLPLVVQTGAEDGVQTLSEGISEGVEMQSGLHIIKRNLAFFIIQEDSQFTGWRLQHQRQATRCQSLHLPGLQPQAPVSPLRTQLYLTLASGRSAGHTERPGSLSSCVHLPVVSARAEALPAQDEEGGAEALRALWVGALPIFVFHLATIIGHNQVPLGCAGVQNDLTWTRPVQRMRNYKKL